MKSGWYTSDFSSTASAPMVIRMSPGTIPARSAGSFGAVAATSFYPSKNLGAYGDAGAVLTNDATLATRLRLLRNQGSEEKNQHPQSGFNSRLDTLQAVVLLAKLSRLTRWNQLRRQAAERYDALLADVAGVSLPRTLVGNEHVWHLYVVRVRERDAIDVRPHVPEPAGRELHALGEPAFGMARKVSSIVCAAL